MSHIWCKLPFDHCGDIYDAYLRSQRQKPPRAQLVPMSLPARSSGGAAALQRARHNNIQNDRALLHACTLQHEYLQLWLPLWIALVMVCCHLVSYLLLRAEVFSRKSEVSTRISTS